VAASAVMAAMHQISFNDRTSGTRLEFFPR